MDQLLAMRVFQTIVDASSLTAAAERLGLTHSSVSRQLKQLEAQFGTQLLLRNTRRLSLTEAGQRFHAACLDILARVDATAEAMDMQRQRPRGTLRVGLPHAIAVLELPDWLPAFQQRYPEVQLDLVCSDRRANLVAEGLDLAVRISSALPDNRLVARLLLATEQILVAAPLYIARHGLPEPASLAAHHRLVYQGQAGGDAWVLQDRGGGESLTWDGPARHRFDAITAVHSATLAGLGVASFTRPTVQRELDQGRLLQVLPQHHLGRRHYHALYPQTPHVAPKVRALIDHLAAHYRQQASHALQQI
ncbi:MAG: LysR substrate-binding domain-containing protein [Comamonas sp.]